jgi:hypothetical protein
LVQIVNKRGAPLRVLASDRRLIFVLSAREEANVVQPDRGTKHCLVRREERRDVGTRHQVPGMAENGSEMVDAVIVDVDGGGVEGRLAVAQLAYLVSNQNKRRVYALSCGSWSPELIVS